MWSWKLSFLFFLQTIIMETTGKENIITSKDLELLDTVPTSVQKLMKSINSSDLFQVNGPLTEKVNGKKVMEDYILTILTHHNNENHTHKPEYFVRITFMEVHENYNYSHIKFNENGKDDTAPVVNKKELLDHTSPAPPTYYHEVSPEVRKPPIIIPRAPDSSDPSQTQALDAIYILCIIIYAAIATGVIICIIRSCIGCQGFRLPLPGCYSRDDELAPTRVTSTYTRRNSPIVIVRRDKTLYEPL